MMLLSIFLVASRAENLHARTIDILAGYSFGIFFLHGYFVAAMRILEERGLFSFAASGLNLILFTALVCLACIAVIQAVKRIFGRYSRYLVST